MSTLGQDLKKLVRGEVEEKSEILEKFSRDASLFKVVPEVVVAPTDADDVASVVRYVARKKETPKTHLSVTARAAGTDMSGGPLNDSIILDTTKHLNHFLELGKDYAVVEPGMYFRDFDKNTKKKDLELPSYTASRELCTVGGMVANNSGGEKNLKYGKTARYVKELEVVLSDGQKHVLKELKDDALAHKLTEESFEGDIYRKVASLVSNPAYKKIIEAHTPKVEKNSSGYALWDIGDGKTRLNLARLMVGAQGTLGIITKIKFGLVHPKPYAAMAVVFVKDLAQLAELVPEILAYKPDSFESYDDHVVALVAKYFPEFASQMKAGILKIGLKFLPEVWMALTGGIPKIVLLVEFRAENQLAATLQAEALAAQIRKNKSRVKVNVMRTEEAARKYWVMRREAFNLLRKKLRGLRSAPFIDDFVVPPLTIPEFLPKLEELFKQYTFPYAVTGHVGDGNFHIFPLINPNDATAAKMIDELSHKVYDLVLQYEGSISGEHNDGLIRTPYVEKMFGPDMYALFMQVKKIFDPHDIFNPGKKVGGNFGTSFAHLDLPGVKSTIHTQKS